MSISMNLEADFHLNRKALLRVLQQLGVTTIIEEENGLSGNFPISNMYFYFNEEERDFSLKAEDPIAVAEWDVKARMVFYYVIAEIGTCNRQLHEFSESLDELTLSNFVLSFQSERVYAIRDKEGLKFFNGF